MHTKNLGEAAYLYALGMSFEMTINEDGRAVLTFDDRSAKDAASDYYSGAKIEAVKLIEAYKTVKTKVHEKLKTQRRTR
jgi:hypothetical protein